MEDRIQLLLDLYWEGETSPEEEKEIRQYFLAGNIRPEHKSFAPLFHYFEKQQEITAPELDFSHIESLAGSSGGGNTSTKVIKLRWVYAVAAVFVFGLASWFVFQNPKSTGGQSTANVQEIEDPDEAYRVTMEALALVSGKLNKGTESIQMGLQNVHKASIIK